MLLTDLILTTTHSRGHVNDNLTYKTDDYHDYDPHNLTKLETKRNESDYLKKSALTNKENESVARLSGDGNNNALVRGESDLKINNPKDKAKIEEEIKRELEDAVEYGLAAMRELLEVKEPQWYQMGLYLGQDDPASHVANFGAPIRKAIELSKFGYASIEAAQKIAELYPGDVGRQSDNSQFDTRLPQGECPLRGFPRCPPAARRYRTADGTCNNLNKPWRGASLLPMQRFLPPVYDDGIQKVRRSIFNKKLPSARDISIRIHRDKNLELPMISLMFMQWGQLIDHDVVSTVKSRSFNGSVPRCCLRGGQDVLPPELTHPSCLPIEVSPGDWFFGPLGIRCIEFIRSAPSTRIDCDVGFREQINQATSYLDASNIYGSEIETSDSMRTFRNGKLRYGRIQGREPLQPPDPPGGEICRFGALAGECLQTGDGRFSEQPGLTALHSVWVRYHNRVAEILSQINKHWSDEKVYQETRRIVIALFQHITYKEFLPILLGKEVMELFELNVEKKGYYAGYDQKVNPTIANSFGAAAFRLGHSLVQNSFVRFDTNHRPLFNNVTLHEEQENIENIWSFGSLDRLILGFCNQPSQRRDEFICEELTNHLFQPRGIPFGMDLMAINIQRGRDHGLPGYTSWREPCGLSPIKSWTHLQKIMSSDTVRRFKSLYDHVDDIDLFSGGLAEKPVRGGVAGPTFACIIAQQFLNLRKGDRFWYENGEFENSLTPAQLQQIRNATFANILCQTLTEIETIQPFVFLTADAFRNSRLPCNSAPIKNFDLSPWVEQVSNQLGKSMGQKNNRRKLKRKPTRKSKTTTAAPLKINVKNITTNAIRLVTKYGSDSYVINSIPPRPTYDTYVDKRTTIRNDVTYLFGTVSEKTTSIPIVTPKPFEVNIKIQYYPPSSSTKRPKPTKKKRKTSTTRRPLDNNYQQTRPHYDVINRPYIYSDDFTIHKPHLEDFYGDKYEDVPFSTSRRPYIYRPNTNNYVYDSRPQNFYSSNGRPYLTDRHDSYYQHYGDVYSTADANYGHDQIDVPKPIKVYSIAHLDKVSNDGDKLNFHSTNRDYNFVKIASVKGEEILDANGGAVQFHVSQREGDLDLPDEGNSDKGKDEEIRLVDIDLAPDETKWLVYNATEEAKEPIQVPNFTFDDSFSTELPKPINGTSFKNDWTITRMQNKTRT